MCKILAQLQYRLPWQGSLKVAKKEKAGAELKIPLPSPVLLNAIT